MIENKIKSRQDFILWTLSMKRSLSHNALNQIIVKNHIILSSFAKKYSCFLKSDVKKSANKSH